MANLNVLQFESKMWNTLTTAISSEEEMFVLF